MSNYFLSCGKIENIGVLTLIIVEKDSDRFCSYCPGFKGVISAGDTEDEALENCLDALRLWLNAALKHGDDIPVSDVQPILQKANELSQSFTWSSDHEPEVIPIPQLHRLDDSNDKKSNRLSV